MSQLEIEIYDSDGKYDSENGHLLLRNSLAEFDKKYKSINWIHILVKNGIKPSNLWLSTHHSTSALPIKINFPEFLVGGGMSWLEFFHASDEPTGIRPNGCFVSALGTPDILDTVWTDYEYNEIKEPVAFGSQVLLHIYTKDLYGQEVAIELTDRDIFDPNDTLFQYRREVNVEKLHPKEEGRKGVDGRLAKEGKSIQHVQKITISVIIDISWQMSAGRSLKVFPTIKSEKTKRFFTGFKRNYLSVQTW